ncbi:MAG: ParM/StbA family protein [Deltaproteobacteria bacterium]|jgi:plasmid segregation protein ParM|nr:ParM/StbA family protein [Deltaproteobacteria bacterium]MBW2487046.1 ParM/StbA family protein [Deltaproteobacteria bacterium]MBW2516243.1 ParM/StbA family protein [Deltaproteobacteria bacterium]
MEVLGIDIGFGFTKATNGKENFIFKSIFGDASEIQFWADFGDSTPTDHIHVTVDGKSYFVGDLAEQQSNVLNFTLDQERLITDYVRILALTIAGLFLKNNSPINVPINVVSGLPIGFFKQNHERFNEILTGHHSITYHSHNGNKTTREIYINKVRMLPQPLGSILNCLMDDSGKIVNDELANQKVGVVDIGFRTTDFTILDHLRYIDRGSRTFDNGISKGFGVISNKLREKCGVSVELYRLYKAAEEGTIKMRGHGFSFEKIRDQVYSQLASTIANDLDRLWTDDWDIDSIILTGGGCRELAQYLRPLITGNVIPIDSNADPRLNNVLGYAKYGRYIWGEAVRENPSARQAGTEQPEPETETAEKFGKAGLTQVK